MATTWTTPFTAINAGDMSTASLTGAAFDVAQHKHLCVQAVASGGASPVGTLTIQESVDGTSYATVATVAVTADGVYVVDLPFFGGHHVKPVYTRTSGGGSLTVKIGGKD